METFPALKFGTTTCLPSGVTEGMKGRVGVPGSSVPTRTRATSASAAPMRALSTSMIETVLPGTPVCWLSRFAAITWRPSGVCVMPQGSGLCRDAVEFRQPISPERTLQVDDRDVVGSPVRREEVGTAIAPAPECEAVVVGEAPPARIGGEHGQPRRWPVGRGEGHGELRTVEPGDSESELDASTEAAGQPVEKGDAVSAVLGEVALGVGDDEHPVVQEDPDGAEAPCVDVPPERVGRPVVFRREHLRDLEHGDLAASAVLGEFRVVDAPVVVDDVGRGPVGAHREVRGVAERPPVQAVERDLAPGDDRVRRPVVGGVESALERDCVDVRDPASRGEDVGSRFVPGDERAPGRQQSRCPREDPMPQFPSSHIHLPQVAGPDAGIRPVRVRRPTAADGTR